MSTERKFQGVWIPASIWLDRSLSITEKVMLVEINSLESADRGCFASNEYFAEFFDLSKSRVSEIISSLANKRTILVELIREGKQIVGRQIWMTERGRALTGGEPSSRNTHTPSSENTYTPLRKTRRPSSEKAATLFGKGGDPSSEKAKESNTNINNTESNTDEGSKPSLPDESGAPNLPAVDLLGNAPEKPLSPSEEVWQAYNAAYFNRYGTEAVRNARVNKNLVDFIARVGKEEAPHIASFYVSHNKRYYLERTHDIGVMLADAEGLRTQWATGRTMTARRAAEIDSTATNANAVNEAIEMLRRRNGNATV